MMTTNVQHIRVHIIPTVFEGARARPQARELPRDLLASLTLYCLCAGSVALVFLDWIFDFGLISFPLGKIIRALLLVVFTIYIVRTGVRFGKHGFRFGRVLGFFLALNLSYTFLSGDIVGNLYYSSRIVFWICGTVVVYRLALSGILSEKALMRTTVSTVLLGAAFTIYLMTLPDIRAGQNASAYLLLWCLPLLLMLKKSMLVNIIVGIAIFAILLTVKRGAMIALGLSIVAYGVTYVKLHRDFRVAARLAMLFALFALIAAYALAHNWDAVKKRFEDKSGSGRDKMYSELINHYVMAEPSNLLLGFGIRSVERYNGLLYHGDENVTSVYAHSDWLQFTHDFGLLGFGFLVWLHVRFLCLVFDGLKKRHDYTPPLVMGYVILFLVNMYSGHLMAPDAFYFGILVAHASAFLGNNRDDIHLCIRQIC